VNTPNRRASAPNARHRQLPFCAGYPTKSLYWSYKMPKSVNKVILVGNVGKDPEVKYLPSGKPVAKFSLATNEKYKDRSDEWQERTEWHNIVAWQRLAEIVGEYVKKGAKLYIEGKLQTSSWEDRESGAKKYRTEIVARDLVLLGSPDGKDAGHRRSRNDYGDQPAYDSPNEITDQDIPF
jgi:single-strand DNA-binding protein